MEDLAQSVVEVQDSYDVSDVTMVAILAEYIESKNLGDDLLNVLSLRFDPPEEA